MPNMTLQKTPAREQEPNIRNKNFKEVSQGYDEELALNEASRCLNCKNMPCVSGSPLIPRTHLLSHWFSWGHTRPQMAGRLLVVFMMA